MPIVTRSLIVLVAASLLMSACSGAKAKPDDFGPEDQVLYSPPPEAKDNPPEVPRSAPVVARERDMSLPESTAPASAQQSVEELNISKDELAELVAQGPSFPLSQVDLRPHRDGDKVVGYRIDGFYSEGARQALAGVLQQGDVITHVMGVSMLSPNNYHLAWSQLGQATSIRVDFLRASQPSFAVWVVAP